MSQLFVIWSASKMTSIKRIDERLEEFCPNDKFTLSWKHLQLVYKFQ